MEKNEEELARQAEIDRTIAQAELFAQELVKDSGFDIILRNCVLCEE